MTKIWTGRLGFAGLVPLLALAGTARAERASAPDPIPLEQCKTADSGVTLDEVLVDGDVVTARGTYSVQNGDGALIEYRIEGDRYEAEFHPGASGTWSFDRPRQTCDHHALRVFVYPARHDEHGFSTICLTQGSSERGQYDIPCNPRGRIDGCAWTCGAGSSAACKGTCATSAFAGAPAYTPFYGVDGVWEADPGGAPGTAWSRELNCKRGQEVQFRVRDRFRVWSPVVRVLCGGQAKP